MALAWVTLPLQFVTTAVGGCLVGCTFGLLLIPLSLVWMVFLALLLATSWVWDRLELLRVPPLVAIVRAAVAVVGIPLALIAEIYVSLMPSMGDLEGRFEKLVTCWVWPFSLDYWRFSVRSKPLESPEDERRYYRLVRALGIAGVRIPPTTDSM
jgi:hypothetical protein